MMVALGLVSGKPANQEQSLKGENGLSQSPETTSKKGGDDWERFYNKDEKEMLDSLDEEEALLSRNPVEQEKRKRVVFALGRIYQLANHRAHKHFKPVFFPDFRDFMRKFHRIHGRY